MFSSLRSLAVAWLVLGLAIVLPLIGADAVAQSPSPAPALEASKVKAELEQWDKFLKLLARGKVENGQPRLVLTPRFDTQTRKITLNPEDEAHLKEAGGQLPQLEAYKQLDPDKQATIANALDELTLGSDPAAGVNDTQVILFDAQRAIDTRIGKLAGALDAMAAVLDARQRQAGLSTPIVTLFQPKVATGPAPVASPVAPAPPKPLDDGPATTGSTATEAPPPLPPCSDARERVTSARKVTQEALRPIDELISAGDRALKNRYFPLAREALEKASDRLAELEREWRDIAESLKPPSYTTADLLDPRCTSVLTKALTEAIAINDILQRVYPKLGEVYTELGQHDRAAREIAKSVAINPNNPKTWAALGYAHLRSDNVDESIRAFIRSVELDTYVPDVWLGLAKAYARKKENQIAIHYIRRAVSKGYVKFEKLASDPDFATLQGVAEFDDLVYLVPGAQPFPR